MRQRRQGAPPTSRRQTQEQRQSAQSGSARGGVFQGFWIRFVSGSPPPSPPRPDRSTRASAERSAAADDEEGYDEEEEEEYETDAEDSDTESVSTADWGHLDPEKEARRKPLTSARSRSFAAL